MAVIAPPGTDRVFVGNVLSLEGKSKRGFLTVGMDVDKLVKELVLSVTEAAFLVHGGQVVAAYTEEGNPIENIASLPFSDEMLNKKSGIVKWEGHNYYYLHMIPFSKLDLHFFVLEHHRLIAPLQQLDDLIVERLPLLF